MVHRALRGLRGHDNRQYAPPAAHGRGRRTSKSPPSAPPAEALWRSAARIEPGGARAYLGGIARNRARDALRAHRLELPLEDDVLSLPSPGPDEAAAERELIERTRAAVDAMPEPDREIFLRHYYYGQGVAETAAALNMNVNTVKTRLRRGRERLRAELTKGDA